MRAVVAVCAAILLVAAPSEAQTRLSFRGFGDVGLTTFSAGDSFDAILGSASGVVFGVGGEAVLSSGIFAGVRVSRFRKTGERVAIVDGELFELGIPATVTVMPVQVTGGYRFNRRTRTGMPARVVPFVGGGLGWHRLTETSEFATDDENVSSWHIGVHALGGAEVRVTRLIGVAGEAQWSAVPDALGDASSGVSQLFDETDLGGLTFRLKVVVGR